VSIIAIPCRADCFPYGAIAGISFFRVRYVFAFDDAVGTLIYSTTRIVSLHKPEKRRRPKPHSGKTRIEPVARMPSKKYCNFINNLLSYLFTIARMIIIPADV